jgi:hypothetical protein
LLEALVVDSSRLGGNGVFTSVSTTLIDGSTQNLEFETLLSAGLHKICFGRNSMKVYRTATPPSSGSRKHIGEWKAELRGAPKAGT